VTGIRPIILTGLKTLAIKFKYLGDVVLMVPALRALRKADPEGELHVLVAAEAVPLLEPLGLADRIWGLPRRSRSPVEVGRLIKTLRAERFDRSIDFVGNDRGAFLSRAIAAQERVGLTPPLGFLGRQRAYHRCMPDPGGSMHQIDRDLALLDFLQIDTRDAGEPMLKADPVLADQAAKLVPPEAALLHLSTSQAKKEWPIHYWSRVADLLEERRIPAIFSAGPSEREQALIQDVLEHRPYSRRLPCLESLALFLAAVSRARLLIACDTGPLHMAAALGGPTLSVFGPTPAWQWRPRGSEHLTLTGSFCTCSPHAHQCTSDPWCMAAIRPERVVEELLAILMTQYSSR